MPERPGIRWWGGEVDDDPFESDDDEIPKPDPSNLSGRYRHSPPGKHGPSAVPFPGSSVTEASGTSIPISTSPDSAAFSPSPSLPVRPKQQSGGFVVLSRNKTTPTDIAKDQVPSRGGSACSTSSEGSPVDTSTGFGAMFRRSSMTENSGGGLFSRNSPTSTGIGLGFGSLRAKGSKVFNSSGPGSRRGSLSASVGSSGGTTSRRGSVNAPQESHSRSGSASGSSILRRALMADMDKW